MKIGTLVRLRYHAMHQHHRHIKAHGIGVVIDHTSGDPKNWNERVLVRFPKIPHNQWKNVRLLEIVI